MTIESFEARLAAADRRQVRMFALIGAAALLAIATTVPLQPAWAGIVEDLVSGLFAPLVASIFDGIDGLYDGLASTTSILGDLKDSNTKWNELLGGVFGIMSAVQDTVISPIAKQILTLVFMFRLLSIAKIAESNDMAPIVPKVVMSCIGFFLMLFLVDNAAAIITVGYDMMQHMLQGISDPSTSQISLAVSEDFIKETNLSPGALFAVGLIGGLITLLCTGLAYVIAIFMYYGKVLVLYFQALFAPIPIALMGIDSTRQWGLGYIKNVASTLLSMVIMYMNLKLFPLLYTIIIGGMDSGTDSAGELGQLIITQAAASSGAAFSIIVPLLAINALLIFMLIKSSALAKEILGS